VFGSGEHARSTEEKKIEEQELEDEEGTKNDKEELLVGLWIKWFPRHLSAYGLN